MRKSALTSSQKQKAIEALTLFNQKADRLLNSGFLRHLSINGLKVTFRIFAHGGEAVESNLPDQELVEAFALNARFLRQDNERGSIRNLAQVYKILPIPIKLKRQFEWTRKRLNEHFARSGSLHIVGENLTYRNIFETFMYGKRGPRKYRKEEGI